MPRGSAYGQLTFQAILGASALMIAACDAKADVLEACLKSAKYDTSECKAFLATGGLNKNSKLYGMTVTELRGSYGRILVTISSASLKDEVIANARKLCGVLAGRENPNGSFQYVSPNDETVRDGAMYCNLSNDRGSGQYFLQITKWAASR